MGQAGDEAVLDAAIEAMEGAGTQPGRPTEDIPLEQTENSSGGSSGGESNPFEETAPGSLEEALEGSETAGSESAAGGSESIGELNEALNGSLAKFDGVLLGERGNIQRQEQEAAGAAAGDELPSDDEVLEQILAGNEAEIRNAPAMPDKPTGGGEPAESGSPAVGQQSNEDGEFQTAGAAVVPPDIPEGNDDDVVARQIREAAMKESDPELREKLWDEYRKYKGISKAE